MGTLVAFALVAGVVIVTPGQDTALTVRNTLVAGRHAGFRTAAGVISGQAVWALAASAGVAALLVASEPAFIALKLAGAAYLAYLGVRALVSAVARRQSGGVHVTPAGGGRELRQGLVSNLGNPKMAIFFTSLLPQFAQSFAGMVALGAVFCAMTFAWLALYAAVIARAGDLLQRPRVRRIFDAITGVALIAFGLRLAASHRNA
jgi:threonine/homoserine/homoserine lactone efflux protein